MIEVVPSTLANGDARGTSSGATLPPHEVSVLFRRADEFVAFALGFGGGNHGRGHIADGQFGQPVAA